MCCGVIVKLSTVTLLLLVVSVHRCSSVRTMKCPPCDKIHCQPKIPSKLECRGGATTGVCGCCPVCARVEGERCGGYYNYLGKCDKGLYCDPVMNKRKARSRKKKETEGVCKKVPTQVKDQPPENRLTCKPKCAQEFCAKHPKAICSATDAAEFLQPCQTKCQHTSCSACRFVSAPSCRRCKQDDFRCLRKFGKCVRKDTCSRRKFPCKEKYFDNRTIGDIFTAIDHVVSWIGRTYNMEDTNPRLRRRFQNWIRERGKFQCFVPEC